MPGKRYLGFSLVLAAVLVTVSCSDSGKIRKYKEKENTTDSTSPTIPSTGPATGSQELSANASFQWDTPVGWDENRTPPGFRLAAFTVKSGDKESVCTIIPLPGDAGGLRANAARWLSQITDNPNPDDTTLEKILNSREKFLTKGQFPAVSMDFTPISPHPDSISILASVISVQGNSVFIKMAGEKSHLLENKEKFKALCKSFSAASAMKLATKTRRHKGENRL